MKMKREEILDALHKGIHKVVFKKVDGSERVLNGTLLTEWVEKQPKSTSGKIVKENLSVIKCIDTDINEWRSFKIDALISFE